MDLDERDPDLVKEVHEARRDRVIRHRIAAAWDEPADVPDGWCPVCGGQNGEHKQGCVDGDAPL